MPQQPSFTCPACGKVSYNDGDIREGYCGQCHDWTGTFKDLAKLDQLGGGFIRAYDRQGHEITQSRAMWLTAQPGYKTIGSTIVGNWRVSTVWLPFDHAHHAGQRHIFETMVFKFNDGQDVIDEDGVTPHVADWLDDYMLRYSTEEEARAGHEAIVAEIRVTQDVADEFVIEEVTNRWIL